MRPGRVVAALLLTLLVPAGLRGQEAEDLGARAATPIDVEAAPRPSTTATRTDGPIRVDGRLDEASWTAAERIDAFIQSQPDPGLPPTERTVVRILYDDQALYIGAVCYDSEPDKSVIRTLERDFASENTRDMDIFAVTLDTFLDRRNSFMFLVNPLGGYRDGQTFDDSRTQDFGWDAVVQVRTEVTDSGWTVEMAIPWTTLRFDPSKERQVWGFNLLRRVRRKNEDSYWAPLERRDPLHRMSKAGTLVIPDLARRNGSRNLRFKPYGLARTSPGSITDEAIHGGRVDAGLDLKWGITSGLALDATYNTDFSQVEVDQVQVNLTRFPLFFPEKREFFVENSGSFTFGDVSERNYRMGTSLSDFTLFHSRRIGLTPEGQPIPIVGGTRLTGRAGPYAVGLLNMQTRGGDATPAENFSVVRLRRNVLGGSDVGVLVVNRQDTDGSGGYNRSYGLDANVRLFGSMIVNSYVAATAYRDTTSAGTTTSDRLAGRVSIAWRDRVLDASAMLKQVGDAFRPGVGFVRRNGIRHGYGTAGVHVQPSIPHVQEINPYAEAHYVTDLDDALETRELIGGLGIEFLDGSELAVEVNDRFERLADPFRVRTGIEVPAGGHAFREATLRYTSNRGRSLSGSVKLTTGGYFDGDRTSVGLDLDWRPNPHVTLQLTGSHNDVTLPAGEFTADVFGARVSVAPSTRLITTAYVQYDEAADEVISNLRFNLIHAPLSDFFLVFTERRDVAGGAVLDRLLTAKVTRLLAF